MEQNYIYNCIKRARVKIENDKRATAQQIELLNSYIKYMEGLNNKQYNKNIDCVKTSDFSASLRLEHHNEYSNGGIYARYRLYISPLNSDGFLDWKRSRVDVSAYIYDKKDMFSYIPDNKKTPYFKYDNLKKYIDSEIEKLNNDLITLNNITDDDLKILINDYQYIEAQYKKLRDKNIYFKENNGNLFSALNFYNFSNLL